MSLRRDILEDEDNADRWMISYADFITLLFAFFVVMYAISSVNDEKYRVLSNTLAQAFQVEAASPVPIPVGEPSRAASPHFVDVPDTTAWVDESVGDTHIQDVPEQVSDLGGFGALEGVAVDVDNDWMEISIDADVLFTAANAELSDSAKAFLLPVAQRALRHENPITIEGYTDSIPTQSARYPSNWELSSARASSVARFFVESGVDRTRLAAIGYGENHPLETNATPDGRAKNRRVGIIVARRSDLARNKNAASNKAAVSQFRTSNQPEVEPLRTTDGGLLFSNELPQTVSEPDANNLGDRQ